MEAVTIRNYSLFASLPLNFHEAGFELSSATALLAGGIRDRLGSRG
jgi:hypothetical protein